MDDRISRVRDGVLGAEQALTAGSGGSPSDVASRFVYVVKIVEALPGVGKVRARRLLDSLGLGERDRVGDLRPETTAALLRGLE